VNTSITQFPFLAAALAACVLTCTVSRVSNAVSNTPPDCDGSTPGQQKPCLARGVTCEGRYNPRDCTASIGVRNVKSYAIDTVVSTAQCKTSLAAAKSEPCAEQWYCKWDNKLGTCVSATPVLDADNKPVQVYVPAYSSVSCNAVGCNQ